jgi:hypothetical protein
MLYDPEATARSLKLWIDNDSECSPALQRAFADCATSYVSGNPLDARAFRNVIYLGITTYCEAFREYSPNHAPLNAHDTRNLCAEMYADEFQSAVRRRCYTDLPAAAAEILRVHQAKLRAE